MTPKDTLEALAGRVLGFRLVESAVLTVGPFEDWSGVRSPSRARRRRARGHPQRIRFYSSPDPKFYRIGDMIVAHPVTMAALRARAQEVR